MSVFNNPKWGHIYRLVKLSSCAWRNRLTNSEEENEKIGRKEEERESEWEGRKREEVQSR